MTITDGLPTPVGWRRVPFGRLVDRRKETGQPEAASLSVFLDAGVVPRSSRVDNHNELGEDLAKYLVVRREDLVFNKLRTWQGGFGASKFDGIVSPAYFVCRPKSGLDAQFADYQLHSRPYLAELTRISKWQPPSQFDTPWDQLRAVDLLLPAEAEQRSVASFLDRECARIRDLLREVDEYIARLDDPSIARFAELTREMPRRRISQTYDLQLGKMLDEKQIDGRNTAPYLRNTNVQWDKIQLDDLKVMTFTGSDQVKFQLRTGDLLVCEGGQPGRSAVWEGQLDGCYFQKALVRARPRGDDFSRFLMWALRLASVRGDFNADGTGAAILHVPAERLAATRVPSCIPDMQHKIVSEVDKLALWGRAARLEVERMRTSLFEYRDALITEAVTGHLNVARISTAQIDESRDELRQGASAQAPA